MTNWLPRLFKWLSWLAEGQSEGQAPETLASFFYTAANVPYKLTSYNQIFNWLNAWLTDWLTDWLTGLLTDWLTD